MKRIKADSPEGKKLMEKYSKIMQDGGQITPEQVLSGSAVTGVDPTQQPVNAEVEDGEYLQSPQGEVVEVVGNTHDQGGEKMNLPEGTKVLSDNVKIGVELKKTLQEQYDVDLKASMTFAEAHEKIKKKLGITAAEEEQERYLNLLEKNQEVEDTGTKSVNEQFLANKIQQTEQTLQQKKQEESVVYDMLFQEQEQRKESGDKNIRVDDSTDYATNPEVAQNMQQDGGIIKYQDGATVTTPNDRVQTATTTTTPNTNTNLEQLFQLPAGKYDISELTPEERKKLDADIDAWINAFKTNQGNNWLAALNNVSIVSGSSKTPVSAATRKKLGVTSDVSQEDANIALANKRASVLEEYFKNRVATTSDIPLSDVNLAPPTVTPYSGPDWDPKLGIQSETYKPYQNVGIKLNTAPTSSPRTGARTEQPIQEQTTPQYNPPQVQDVLAVPFPVQTPYRGLPNPLMTTQLNLPEYERVTPIKVSPEEALRENNRGFVAARDVLMTMPGAQVGANVANLLGQTQNVNNQAVAEANRTNANIAMQTQQRNQEMGYRNSLDRTRAMDIFGKENVAAVENTLNDLRMLQQVTSTDQINAQREGRQLRMMDALAPEYTFDQFGNVIFTPTNNQLFLPQNMLQAQLYSAGNNTNPNNNDLLSKALLQALQNQSQTNG